MVSYWIGSQKPRSRVFTVSVSFLAAIIAAFLLLGQAQAQAITYDPYADSVSGTATLVTDPNNAVGAPNGTTANLGGAGATLTLDMGSGEEGTQTLRVHFGAINVLANISVAFLDSGQAVIASETRQLGVDVNPSTQNFSYNWTNFSKAYRYVRLSSTLGASVGVDAVEALGYIGSTPTQDTDGDGTPDRTEQENGTNPLVPDSSGSTPTPSTTNSPGSSTTNNTTNVTNTTNNSSGQVNAPPSADNDKDKDGMDDNWEKANGLDPTNASDAQGDPDNDGLVNLIEYQIGSNPNKADTDGDGMPDKWEYDNGLNVLVNDAEKDPDGDYLTNLGEYKNNTDPNKADNLKDVFCKHKKTAEDWLWLALALVLAAGLAYWAKTQERKRPSEKK